MSIHTKAPRIDNASVSLHHHALCITISSNSLVVSGRTDWAGPLPRAFALPDPEAKWLGSQFYDRALLKWKRKSLRRIHHPADCPNERMELSVRCCIVVGGGG